MNPKQSRILLRIVRLARLAEPRQGIFARILRACLSRRLGPLGILFIDGSVGGRRRDGGYGGRGRIGIGALKDWDSSFLHVGVGG